jgi:hypothetical protein
MAAATTSLEVHVQSKLHPNKVSPNALLWYRFII